MTNLKDSASYQAMAVSLAFQEQGKSKKRPLVEKQKAPKFVLKNISPKPKGWN